MRDSLGADRLNLWLQPDVELVTRPDLVGQAELLEDVSVNDPEFDDWLRDLRLAERAPGAPVMASPIPDPVAIEVRIDTRVVTSDAETRPDAGSFGRMLADAMAQRFYALGEGSVLVIEGGPDVPPGPGSPAGQGRRVLSMSVESSVSAGRWNLHLRSVLAENRQFLWSGRLSVPAEAGRCDAQGDVGAFLNQATTGILSRLERVSPGSRNPFVALQRAARRLFTGELAEIDLALTELAALETSPAGPLAQAWLGFALMTRILEVASPDEDLRAAALDHAARAIRLAPGNALVLALAAQVELKLGSDPERGVYLARLGRVADDSDPYAMLAVSQAELLDARTDASLQAADWARRAARGMLNENFWDLQLALARLAQGDTVAARTLAAEARTKAPRYRPALRYLIALDAIADNRASMARHVTALRLLEPGFAPDDLVHPEYPVATLRRVGLIEALAAALN